MGRISMNTHALVHVQLKQHATSRWEAGSNKARLERSSAALTPFEEQCAGTQDGAVEARGKPPFVEQEPEQSGFTREQQEQGGEEDLDVEMQMRSRPEDIEQQI
jgi:hypothetical protein